MTRHTRLVLILGEIRKRRRETAEPSNSQRARGSFRCIISTNRSTHPPSFIWRAGCHTSLGFHGRYQLLLQTIEQAKRVRSLRFFLPAIKKQREEYQQQMRGLRKCRSFSESKSSAVYFLLSNRPHRITYWHLA